MRSALIPMAALAALVCLTSPRPARSQPSATGDLFKLAWLTGSWRTADGDSYVEEHWTSAEGGLMVGMGRTTKRGKAVFFEFLRIEEGGDGVAYIAQPAGRAPTRFAATSVSGQEVVFENKQHDFPKRIRYTRRSENEVIARVDDCSDSGKSEEFKYERFQLASDGK